MAHILKSRRLESNQLLRVFSAAVHRVSFTEKTKVPRQGIEPCVCRLKAGGFTVEACEARRPVPGAGIEPATSTFKGWQQFQH